ncbi:putative ribosomal protein L11 methyltransferase [Cooperia oncophora]
MKYSLYLARKYAAEGWWDRAIRHYLTVLFTYQNVEQREIEFADEFRTVLESWMCYSRNADSCLSALFAPILNLFPKCVPIVTLLSEHVSGSAIFLEDTGETGVCSYDNLKAAINAECDELMGAVFRVSSANIRSGVFDQWHMFMINDQERNTKFFEALKNTVSSTDHVLDIGTGTGILSVYAARCGALKISAIEANPTLYQMAKRILALNGVANVKVIHEYSYEYDPEEDELADVVVSEILDCCAFGEGVIPAFLDAHLRLTKNTARFIPSNVALFATLLESPSIYLTHSFTSPSGKEYRSEYVPCNGQKPNEPYWVVRVSDLPDAKQLSTPREVLMVDFQNVNELHRYVFGHNGVIEISPTCSGTLHAIAVHFKALIWGDQYIDTSKSTCWEQGIFPLPYPMRVNQGDVVVLKWSLKRTRFDITVDYIANSEGLQMANSQALPNREVILRSQLDYRTMNNDMLLFAITRLLPSISRYSWNLDGELSAEELGVVRYLPHFLIDAKDINGTSDTEVDEGYGDQCVVVWPIRGDGSVSEVFLNLLRSLRARDDIPPSLKHCGYLTDRLSAHGVLVSSERLSKLTRVQQDSQCGADLSPIQMYNLLEYRDIEISTFEHHICSNEFRFLHLGEEDTELLSKKIEVRSTSSGLVEGVLYWWQLDHYYSTRQDRGTFFIFREPISVNVGTVVSYTHFAQ